jgi:hypothetical protein
MMASRNVDGMMILLQTSQYTIASGTGIFSSGNACNDLHRKSLYASYAAQAREQTHTTPREYLR